VKVVIQRTTGAHVKVDDEIVGEINDGLVVLVGVAEGDTEQDIETLANKIINLRIFEDDEGKMNRSLLDIGGSVLSISQFTLYANVRKGNRPSFTDAAQPNIALELYDLFNEKLKERDVHVETGQFGEMMDVQLHNDGPVTIIIESIDGKIVHES